jgi:hypothetical protein
MVTPIQKRIYATWHRYLAEMPNMDNEILPQYLPDGPEWVVREIIPVKEQPNEQRTTKGN